MKIKGAEIDFIITKGGKLRVRIKEHGCTAYMLTPGGVSWHRGKGKPFHKSIINKMEKIVYSVSEQLEGLSQPTV